MNIQELQQHLRQNGFKVTPQRLAVYQALQGRTDHPTAEEIYKKVRENNPSISLATVYQTLHLLSRIGLVQQLGFGDKKSRFDPSIEPHINIICPDCGQVTDLHSETVSEFWINIQQELAGIPISHRFDIYVLCDRCQAAKN